MKSSLVEVEYVKGGRRRRMRKHYADTLTKLGVVRAVDPSQATAEPEAATPARVRAQRPSPEVKTRDVKAEDIEEKPKRKPRAKSTYKRRDMRANGKDD